MITNYIKTTHSGEGFITHTDQEVDGLSFRVELWYEDYNYVKVTGEQDKINVWKTRVEGIDTTEEEIQSIIATLPQQSEPQ